MTVKTTVNYAKCSIAVLGFDMKCFMCGTMVPSGTRHECEKREPVKVSRKKKLKKASSAE